MKDSANFFISYCVAMNISKPLLLFLLGCCNLVFPQDIKDMNVTQLLKLFQDTIHYGVVSDEDIRFFLQTRPFNPEDSVSVMDTKTISMIDTSKPTKFLIHGWIANRGVTWYKEVTEELLKKQDCNVIQVDWSRPARSSYISAAVNTRIIGEQLAQFINRSSIPPSTIHLIGHSLGSHIAGFAAKKLLLLQLTNQNGGKIHRITGLDPAGPFFNQFRYHKDGRLDRGDADIVDVLHTDAGIYGIDFAVGSLDIVFNGGHSPQPGCLEYLNNVATPGQLVSQSFCSHAMSCRYFTDWINRRKIECYLCNNFLKNISCTFVKIGEEDVTENVKGICYTRTHKTSLFTN